MIVCGQDEEKLAQFCCFQDFTLERKFLGKLLRDAYLSQHIPLYGNLKGRVDIVELHNNFILSNFSSSKDMNRARDGST